MIDAEKVIKRYGFSWDVYIRDKLRCQYCGFDGSIFENWRQLSIDHIIPGNGDSLENCAVACTRCNSKKSNWVPDKLNVDRESLILQVREYLQAGIENDRVDWLLMMDRL